MRRSLIAAALAVCAGAAAADPIDDAIRARRGFFTLLGVEIGPLVAMARGDAEYDAAKAEGHAANLAALAGYSAGSLFVEGSSNADKPGATRALPAIWANMSDFGAKAEGFAAAVAALQPRAGAGRAELGAGVQALGAACQACHDSYRARDF